MIIDQDSRSKILPSYYFSVEAVSADLVDFVEVDVIDDFFVDEQQDDFFVIDAFLADVPQEASDVIDAFLVVDFAVDASVIEAFVAFVEQLVLADADDFLSPSHIALVEVTAKVIPATSAVTASMRNFIMMSIDINVDKIF